MSVLYSLNLTIAKRFGFKSKSHKFATFVAVISIIGIAIGVASLIIDTSIMQGLHNNIKKHVLSNEAHITVNADSSAAEKIIDLEHVIAVCPYVEDEVLVQSDRLIALAKLSAIDTDRLYIKDGFNYSDLRLEPIPEKGSYKLNAAASVFLSIDARLNSRVKIICTSNARYTPMGLTPTARLFRLASYFPSANSGALPAIIGNYEDVRKLFRQRGEAKKFRIFLDDPFFADDVNEKLDAMGLAHSDWRSSQGEFFRALAMEKIAMTIMLCLIIVVAAFNILSALAMTVSARLNDIAVLKTLGMSNYRIMLIFLTAGCFSGLIGTLSGMAFGIPVTYIISDVISSQTSMSRLPVSIELSNILFIGLGSMLMSLLFTLYPAVKAASSNPVDNLTRG